MQLAYPETCWWSVGAALVAVLAVAVLVRKRLGLRRLAGRHTAQPLLLVRYRIQWLRVALLTATAALLAIAVRGPQWGQTTIEATPVDGRDVLIVLDVSRSMLTRDVSPSRLERAKADVRDLAAALKKKGGYRVGLIAFADRAVLLCPLTSDYRCFEEELARLTLSSLRLRGNTGSADGTQIGQALRRAELAIHKPLAEYTDIVLISDGDDMEEDTLAAADQLASAGVPVHTVGVGNPLEASPIPIQGPTGGTTYLTYQGETVRTKLEEKVLREVAGRTKGQYVAAGTDFLELDRWFENIVAGKRSRELAATGSTPLAIHRFQWFLLPAVLLLLLETLLNDAARASAAAVPQPNYFAWASRKRKPAVVMTSQT